MCMTNIRARGDECAAQRRGQWPLLGRLKNGKRVSIDDVETQSRRVVHRRRGRSADNYTVIVFGYRLTGAETAVHEEVEKIRPERYAIDSKWVDGKLK